MGRPPLNVFQTTVRLSRDDADRIDWHVGTRNRAVFIREAIREKLDRMEADASATAKLGATKDD